MHQLVKAVMSCLSFPLFCIGVWIKTPHKAIYMIIDLYVEKYQGSFLCGDFQKCKFVLVKHPINIMCLCSEMNLYSAVIICCIFHISFLATGDAMRVPVV